MDTLMKICSDCKKELELESFPYDKSRDRYLSVCKPCTSKRTQAYRLKNKDKWGRYSAKHAKKYKQLISEWKSQGCKKCGENRSNVIDAHHINPEEKSFMIGTAQRGIGPTKIELKKCIPLCSNCHRDFHYQEKETGMSIKEYVHL